MERMLARCREDDGDATGMMMVAKVKLNSKQRKQERCSLVTLQTNYDTA
jgi:hypothetical protein